MDEVSRLKKIIENMESTNAIKKYMMIKHTVSMKNMHYKFGNLIFFIYLCKRKLNNNFKKNDWYGK